MSSGAPAYLGGMVTGFALCSLSALLLLPQDMNVSDVTWSWVELNLGSSVWLFTLVSCSFVFTLVQLQKRVMSGAEFKSVIKLDQLSDLWIHVFVGIGVVWTAVGMRNALSVTLAVPQSLNQDAGGVLGRLVDGGILLALTTTIVGAIGGYLMRLCKTLWLGAELSAFYHQHDRTDAQVALERLNHIEQLLADNIQDTDHAISES